MLTWPHQVHFGLMVVVMSSEPGTYPFSEVRFSFDFVGYLAGSTVLALLLHLLVRRTCTIQPRRNNLMLFKS